MNQLGSSGSFAFAITTALSLSACNNVVAAETDVIDTPCQQVAAANGVNNDNRSADFTLAGTGLQLDSEICL
ncbi:hypothetical protein IC617_02760 [Neiella sp. HB171785]|uniref:Uncharacterized protein n=1 Tax=Neiella litorisoli TaxID=2771431 RepID=A0A8J6UIC8_9GAMM|nr:hypothetical protein [Neiella litorisoli]MBD1388338.1 hypothetical protein [Neiella litorisoli]